MTAIPVRPPTMSNPRFGTDFGTRSIWERDPPPPSPEETSCIATNKLALALLGPIFAEDFAVGRPPLGGYVRMRPKQADFSSDSLIEAADGTFWIPIDQMSARAGILEIVEDAPAIGPAATLVLWLERAAAERRIPMGFTLVQHPDPTASCSIDGFGPTVRLSDGTLMVPHIALEAMTAHGHRPVAHG